MKKIFLFILALVLITSVNAISPVDLSEFYTKQEADETFIYINGSNINETVNFQGEDLTNAGSIDALTGYFGNIYSKSEVFNKTEANSTGLIGKNCSNGEILEFNAVSGLWECGTDSSGISQAYADANYLKLNGSNANTNIDIGSYNITANKLSGLFENTDNTDDNYIKRLFVGANTYAESKKGLTVNTFGSSEGFTVQYAGNGANWFEVGQLGAGIVKFGSAGGYTTAGGGAFMGGRFNIGQLNAGDVALAISYFSNTAQDDSAIEVNSQNNDLGGDVMRLDRYYDLWLGKGDFVLDDNNHGIKLGETQTSYIWDDGTNLNMNTSGEINFYNSTGWATINAHDFVTHTFNESENPLEMFIENQTYYNYWLEVEDRSKPVYIYEEVETCYLDDDLMYSNNLSVEESTFCFNETIEKVDYPYTKLVKGQSSGKLIEDMKGAFTDLNANVNLYENLTDFDSAIMTENIFTQSKTPDVDTEDYIGKLKDKDKLKTKETHYAYVENLMGTEYDVLDLEERVVVLEGAVNELFTILCTKNILKKEDGCIN